ncbi:MAG: hypothetical protein ACOX50_02085 [Patescibacteria group bacterium]
MKKITCTIKSSKLVRFGLLFGLREGYLFVKNLYGIYTHPFLTIKRIVSEKDLSQAVLIFGLPVYLWFGWIFILLISRIFIFGELKFGFLAKTSFLTVSFVVSLLFLFISYCLWSYFSKTKHKVI